MFLETKTLIANRARKGANTTDLSRIGEFINDILQLIYNETGYVDHVDETLTTTDGEMAYGLAPYLFPVNSVMTLPAEDRHVQFMPRVEWERRYPDPDEEGIPRFYTIIDEAGVLRQPASKIRAASSSASDGPTKTITYTGISNYKHVTETVTLAGTSNADGSTEFTRFTAPPTMSAAAAGTVTVSTITSGNTVSSITVGNTYSTFISPHQTITLVSTSASDTQKASVEGTIIVASAGNLELPYTEQITMTGTTPVSTTQKFCTVRRVSLASAAVGLVTVKSLDRADTVIGYIPIGRMSCEHQIAALYPIPDATYSLRYRGTRSPAKLTNDGDRPTIDHRVWPYVIRWAEYAVLDFYGERRGITSIAALPAWDRDMREIKRIVGGKINDVILQRGSNGAPLVVPGRTNHWDPNLYGEPR